MQLVAAGRDADVYDHGPGLVLRRYRDGRDATAEADLLRELERRGYPVPRVHRAGGSDIVMTRVLGPTLESAVHSGLVAPVAGGAILAGLHHRLHGSTPSAEGALLHLDLHPANVLLGEEGPVVVDWCNARRGPADLDVAMTALILAQVALTRGLVSADPVEDAAARRAAPALLAAFADDVTTAYRDHLDDAAALRRLDPNQTPSQRALLARSVDLARSPRTRDTGPQR